MKALLPRDSTLRSEGRNAVLKSFRRFYEENFDGRQHGIGMTLEVLLRANVF